LKNQSISSFISESHVPKNNAKELADPMRTDPGCVDLISHNIVLTTLTILTFNVIDNIFQNQKKIENLY
jgi:hypothetical protein